MSVRKVKGGYRWGKSGKVYPTKAQAERQGRAIHASGYQDGGIVDVTQGDDPSAVDRVRNFMGDSQRRYQTMTDRFGLPIATQIEEDQTEKFTPSPGQLANFSAMLLPGSGYIDASGNWPSLQDRDKPFSEAFSGVPYPSMAENLQRGGWGGYFDASMQGLGLAGDALYAAPVVGPLLGATVGTSLKGIANLGKVGKAVRAASKSDEGIAALKTDVDMFARDDSGFISPTIQALIEKAPANLKGQQITEWANANSNKGVKPKELEFLGLDEFVAANPSATTREAVEGISGNKVRVSQNVRRGEGEALEFESTIPETHPLDGSSLWKYQADQWRDEIGQLAKDDELIFPRKKDLLDQYNKERMSYRTRVESYDDIPESMLDEVIDDLAKHEYMENPYEMLTPQGERFGSGTFAFGNDEVGYQLFVDGQRVTDTDNIAYSRTEAEIQLQQKLGLETYGETKFKTQVDNSLPGGENYREVVFNWDNAPEAHYIGHFDDETQIAHALIRDRILDDGTPSLHIDELQSDLHTAGSREGYRIPPKQREEIYRKLEDYLKDNKTFKFEHIDGEPGILNTTDNTFTTFEMLSDARHYLKKYAPYRQQVTLRDLMEIDEFVDIIEPILDEGSVPDYPFKDNWHEMVLKNLLLDAAREGKPALSVSGSAPIKSRYSDEYSKFYEMLYDKKVPSFMKKLANRYGGEFEQGRLDFEDTFDEIKPFIDDVESVEANIIRITPEMRERILEEGIPSFGAGGIVDITQGTDPSMVDRVGNFMKERM